MNDAASQKNGKAGDQSKLQFSLHSPLCEVPRVSLSLRNLSSNRKTNRQEFQEQFLAKRHVIIRGTSIGKE